MRSGRDRAWLARSSAIALVVSATAIVGTTSAQSVPPPGATTAPPACPTGMVFIHGGTVTLGDPRATFNKAHTVTLPDYCIDEHEVSVADFLTWRGSSAHCWGNPTSPVECATFTEATAYCAARGKHLPTDDEWEYAARGPLTLAYPWGAKWIEQPRVPGSFATDRSPFGAYGMFGQPLEWSVSARCTRGPFVNARRGSIGGGSGSAWRELFCTFATSTSGFRCAK